MRKLSFIAILAFIAIFMLESCATNGYGCKGRSKLITRVKQFN